MGTAIICERCGKGVNSDEEQETCPNCGAPLGEPVPEGTPFADNTVGSMAPAKPQEQLPQEDDNRAGTAKSMETPLTPTGLAAVAEAAIKEEMEPHEREHGRRKGVR